MLRANTGSLLSPLTGVVQCQALCFSAFFTLEIEFLLARRSRTQGLPRSLRRNEGSSCTLLPDCTSSPPLPLPCPPSSPPSVGGLRVGCSGLVCCGPMPHNCLCPLAGELLLFSSQESICALGPCPQGNPRPSRESSALRLPSIDPLVSFMGLQTTLATLNRLGGWCRPSGQCWLPGRAAAQALLSPPARVPGPWEGLFVQALWSGTGSKCFRTNG